MERKLATIQVVKDIQAIPNADRIVLASFNDVAWKCIIKKDELKVGDKAIYLEVDSLVPEKPEFEFLRIRKFRIKTMRMRGVLSQGICFPLSILPSNNYVMGQDVTEIMGVKKWEPETPIQLRGVVRCSFPTSYVPKTDEFRIQSYPNVINEIMGKEVYISTKINGTSSSFVNVNGDIYVCGRNIALLEDANNVYWQIYKKYNIEIVLKRSGNYAIQGECAGIKIQKNPLKLSDIQLFVFNVYDINNAKYLNYKEFIEFCRINSLLTVPIEEICTFNFTIEQLLERAKGTYNSGNLKEGIVIRPTVECYSETLQGRMSFKVLNNDLLEKED